MERATMERATRQPPARHMHSKYNKPSRNSTTNSLIPRIITIIPTHIPHQNKQNNPHTNPSDRILDMRRQTHAHTTAHNDNKNTNGYELCFHNFLLPPTEDMPSIISLQLLFLNTCCNNSSTREYAAVFHMYKTSPINACKECKSWCVFIPPMDKQEYK